MRAKTRLVDVPGTNLVNLIFEVRRCRISLIEFCNPFQSDLDERLFEVTHAVRFDRLPVISGRRKSNGLRSLDGEKVIRALFLAAQKGIDGVVILIDREKKSQPDRAGRMKEGRKRFRENSLDDFGPACAVGAACRSIETWLLVDSDARRDVFGDDSPDPFSKDPEERPAPRKLKEYIQSRCAGKGIDPYTAYENLARYARPAELERRCRTSYPPFAEDVGVEIGPLISSDGK